MDEENNRFDYIYCSEVFYIPTIDDPDFLNRLKEYFEEIGLTANSKWSGIFSAREQVVGRLRQERNPFPIYRKIIFINGNGSYPHEITEQFKTWAIWGVIGNGSTSTNITKFQITDTNIIVNESGNFTEGHIIIEYIKNFNYNNP